MKWEIYDIRTLTDAEYEKWYSLMSTEKKKRVDGFRFTDDKKRSVCGEMLARIMISDWCGVPPESIVFSITEHGKPIAADLAIHFNISHSGDIVVCAVDDDPVGIDVEKLKKYNPSVAQLIFTSEEVRIIEKNENPSEKFIQIWTTKEAYAKFVGTGLSDTDFKASILGKISQFKFRDYYISICQTEQPT